MTAPELDSSGDVEGDFTSVKSADRALIMLDLLAGREPMRLVDIAAELGLPKSSTWNLLRTMVQRRYLTWDPADKRFSIGPRIATIARLSEGPNHLVTLAQPLMDALVEETRETVQLAELDGIENVYLAISESPHPMKLVSKVGGRLYAHATGVGKTLLAHLPEQEAERRLRATELPRFTPYTIVEVPQLLDVLRSIREQGYGTDEQEYVLGCRCIAMPVRRANGTVIAAMSVSIPTPRYDDAVGERALARLRETVEALSRRLGYLTDGT